MATDPYKKIIDSPSRTRTVRKKADPKPLILMSKAKKNGWLPVGTRIIVHGLTYEPIGGLVNGGGRSVTSISLLRDDGNRGGGLDGGWLIDTSASHYYVSIVCPVCGKETAEPELRDKRVFCPDCAPDVHCSVCGSASKTVNFARNDEGKLVMVCEACIKLADLVRCKECGEFASKKDMHSEDKCKRCFSNRWFTCVKCKKDQLKDFVIVYRKQTYCHDCACTHLKKCTLCHRWHAKNQVVKAGGYSVCHKCRKLHMASCPECKREALRNEFYEHPIVDKRVCGSCYHTIFPRIELRSTKASDALVKQIMLKLSDGKVIEPVKYKYRMSFNENDDMLAEIAEKVGTIDTPIYVYGLRDRADYGISMSSALKHRMMPKLVTGDHGEHLIATPIGPMRVVDCSHGSEALGICAKLRTTQTKWVTNFIKSITAEYKEE